jgi:hypothetical protein
MGARKYSDQALADLEALARRKILQAYAEASVSARDAGVGWYPAAHAETVAIAEAGGWSVETASAIVAILSPMVSWAHNLADAWELAYGGDEPTYALPDNADKVKRILEGEPVVSVIGGRKVRSFRQNIRYPLSSAYVTLDTHMANLFGVDPKDVFERVGVYEALQAGVKAASRILGVTAPAAQAVAWIVQSGRDDDAADLRSAGPVPY